MVQWTPLLQWLPFVAVGLAWLAGGFVDIMEIDAAQYANMSRELLESANPLQLFDRSEAYLDKPPLIFWSTALSYKIFGVSIFSYKLPSVLFSAWAVFSTWKFGKLLHNDRTAYIAALIVASAQSVFLMNNDVKTDMYLLAAVIFSVWKLYAYHEKGGWANLILGFFGIGLGMLAKGPLALVIPALALGFGFIVHREWKGILKWQWLLGLPVIALTVLPFCIGLYQQYGQEGVEFFLWTQSFGRITGASEWTNDASPLFFVHTFLWAFLPWSFLFIPALGRKIVRLAKGLFYLPARRDAINLGGFLLTFLALSMSRFKLPHYIFVVLPFAAIMTAEYVDRVLLQQRHLRLARAFGQGHTVFLLLALLGVGFLTFWAFPEKPVLSAILLIPPTVAIVLFGILRKDLSSRLIFAPALGIASLNLFLNLSLYPQLLEYQTTSAAGKEIVSGPLYDEIADRLYSLGESGRGLDFHYGRIVEMLSATQASEIVEKGNTIYLYSNQEGKDEIGNFPVQTEVISSYDHFMVQKLSLPFINPETRPKKLKKRYLLKLSPRP